MQQHAIYKRPYLIRTTATVLLVGITAAITLPVAAAYAQPCETCEWTCDARETERAYHRCMQRCMDRCYSPPPPDDEPFQADTNDQLIAVGFLIGAVVFVAVVVSAIQRHRNRRISGHCMRVANALEREAASYRAEAMRRDPDL
jgi:hypothetical protein